MAEYFVVTLLAIGFLMFLRNLWSAIIGYGELKRLEGQQQASDEWEKFTRNLVKAIQKK